MPLRETQLYSCVAVLRVDRQRLFGRADRLLEVRDVVEDDGQPVAFGGDFEVGRPPGLKPGTPLDFPVAMNSTPLPLEPGRYEWRLTIDGKSHQDWTLAFTVRRTEEA